MNAENTKALIDGFPELFPPQAMDDRTGLMGYGFAHGDGWLAIVRDLLGDLATIRRTLPEGERDAFWVFQAKEKFGLLRVYLDRYPKDPEAREAAMAAIRVAEELSSVTCEVCGKPGTLRRGGWLRTLCDEHDRDRPSAWDDVGDWEGEDEEGKGQPGL